MTTRVIKVGHIGSQTRWSYLELTQGIHQGSVSPATPVQIGILQTTARAVLETPPTYKYADWLASLSRNESCLASDPVDLRPGITRMGNLGQRLSTAETSIPLSAAIAPVAPATSESANIDFSPLWDWKKLRTLGNHSSHRALAREWASHVLKSASDWLLIDTETTGLGGNDQIIEIAICRPTFRSGILSVEKIVHQRMRPSVSISDSAYRVHGISMNQLRNEPCFSEVLPAIHQAIKGKKLIAWNANFDRSAFLRTADAWRCATSIEANDWYCAMRAHAVWKGDRGMRTLYRNHKLQGDHSAIGDIRMMLSHIVRMTES